MKMIRRVTSYSVYEKREINLSTLTKELNKRWQIMYGGYERYKDNIMTEEYVEQVFNNEVNTVTDLTIPAGLGFAPRCYVIQDWIDEILWEIDPVPMHETYSNDDVEDEIVDCGELETECMNKE